jgi:hypothetical protein
MVSNKQLTHGIVKKCRKNARTTIMKLEEIWGREEGDPSLVLFEHFPFFFSSQRSLEPTHPCVITAGLDLEMEQKTGASS